MSEQPPKWFVVTVSASPAIPLVGLGLMKVQREDESWVAVIPFLLIAAFAVVVVTSVYVGRDRSLVSSEAPYWPRSRLGARLYVAATFLLPIVLLVIAIVAVISAQWLAGAIFLAMMIPATMVRLFLLTETRRAR